MKDALMKGALPIYARMLADSCGVQVEFGHATASTNGTNIFLPDLPLDDPSSKALAYGMIMHEAGHISETSFSVWPKNPVIADMANRLEDVRMEACQMRKYPGGRQRLSTMVDALVATGYFGPPRAESSPNEAMAAYVLYRLRADVLGQQAVKDYADIAESACRKALPGSAVTRLGALMNEVTECRNTADVVVLATEIVKMLEEEQQNAEQEAQQDADPSQQQSDPQQGQDSSGGDQGQGSTDDSSSAQGGGQPSDQGGHSAQDGQQHGDSQGSGSDASGPDPDAADKAQNLRNILSGADNKGMVDVGDTLKEALGAISQEKRYESITMPKAYKANHGFGDASSMLDRVSSGTRALRRRLANELEAVAQSHQRIGRTGNRLAANRLYRLETMNPRVFERVEMGQAVNTAISILIDRSGSMSQTIELAIDAAFSLYAALDKIHGVATQVATFPHYVHGSYVGVGVLSDFGDKLSERAPCFTGVSASGGTPLGEAMLWAGAELVRRKETRKILFICTDGDPDNGDKVREVTRLLEAEQVEIICLGIKHDARAYFPASRTIWSIADMPATVFEMMQRQLLRKAA